MRKVMNEKMKNRKGFTLIELVVVIAILGILAALAIPRLTGSKLAAERNSVEANLRTIDGAISMWEAENTEAPTNTNLIDGTKGTLRAWPKGPGDAVYFISSTKPYRALVKGEVGGKTFADTGVALEDITWE